MPITEDPLEFVAEDLSVELGVHNGMTKTVRRIRKNGTLKFKNKFNTVALTIESQDDPPPFLVPGVADPQSQFVVPAGINLTVTVSGAYTVPSQFAYTAKLEGTAPEDPIVIIDRH